MKSHARFQLTAALIVTLFMCFVSISGCATWIGMATGSMPDPITGDNAFRVSFERPPHEALNDLRGHLETSNIKILSVNGDTLRSDPGDLHGGLTQGMVPEIRLIAVAEATKKGSRITVKPEYLDPTSGEWRAASTQTNVLRGAFLGTQGEETKPHIRAYTEVGRLLIGRYGTSVVKFVHSDLQY